jgi:hypothetical protein
MNQILHIFRKDVRQFWREIALSVGLLAAYAWYEPREWVPNPGPASWRTILPQLVLFGWAFVIVRDIQAEVLVGDRQFWVTRPYEWKKLLAAKILFVAVVFNLLLLIADTILLKRAGFAPVSYVPGLLWMQLLLTVLLVLPVTTLGTVTSNVGQAVLVVLGVLVYFLATEALSLATHKSQRQVWLPFWLFILTLLTFVAVIALQYARRKTTLVRGLLVGLAMTGLLFVTVGTSSPPWVPDAREYPLPAAGEQPPVQLSVDPTEHPRSEQVYRRGKEVQVRIPLQASGQAKDSLVQTNGTMITIDAGGGLRWSSDWQESGPVLFPGQEHSQVDFTVDKNFFERTKSLPAAVQFSFVMTVFRQKDERRVFITSEDFAVPGVGICSTLEARNAIRNGIWCRYPLRLPHYQIVSTVAEETTCTVSDQERPKLVGATLYARLGGGGWGPAELGLSPVHIFDRILRPPEGEWGTGRGNEWPLLCPGTPLVFSYLERVQRLHMEVHVSGLELGDYTGLEVRNYELGQGQ